MGDRGRHYCHDRHTAPSINLRDEDEHGVGISSLTSLRKLSSAASRPHAFISAREREARGVAAPRTSSELTRFVEKLGWLVPSPSETVGHPERRRRFGRSQT